MKNIAQNQEPQKMPGQLRREITDQAIEEFRMAQPPRREQLTREAVRKSVSASDESTVSTWRMIANMYWMLQLNEMFDEEKQNFQIFDDVTILDAEVLQ